jgi:hypothetical protein
MSTIPFWNCRCVFVNEQKQPSTGGLIGWRNYRPGNLGCHRYAGSQLIHLFKRRRKKHRRDPLHWSNLVNKFWSSRALQIEHYEDRRGLIKVCHCYTCVIAHWRVNTSHTRALGSRSIIALQSYHPQLFFIKSRARGCQSYRYCKSWYVSIQFTIVHQLDRILNHVLIFYTPFDP